MVADNPSASVHIIWILPWDTTVALEHYNGGMAELASNFTCAVMGNVHCTGENEVVKQKHKETYLATEDGAQYCAEPC